MTRQLLRPPDADRERSLGWLALWWIETLVVHGPGDVQGEPVRHGDEYSGFIVDSYALDSRGHRLVDSAFFSRPKGCNKSGLAAELALFEALGPCRFSGWAQGGETFEYLGHVYTYAPGEPMGRAVKTPFVRIMATEETQTGNVYDTIYFNLDSGPLSELKAYGLDAGLTRILLPFGGEITPSTAGSASKDGGKETFVVFDESHLYATKMLRQMYKTVTRNLVKRKRIAETWFIETTTMYLPGEESVAEETFKYAQAVNEGKARGRMRMVYDHRWSDLKDLSNLEALEGAVKDAYGEALEWNDLQGVIDDIFDPRRTPEESRRYFLNALTEAHNAWVTPAEMASVTAGMPGEGISIVSEGETITLGFDGSINDDATALIGCRVSDGYLFEVRIEEIPDGPESDSWAVDTVAFDAAVSDMFARYNVVGFFADPPHWQDYIDAWEKEFGDQLRVKSNNAQASMIRWWTKNDNPMALALQRLNQHIRMGTVKMSANPQLVRHFVNARRWGRRGGIVIGKEGKHSPKKMDAAMAATLAFEARAQFLKLKEPEQPDTFVPIRVR